MGFTIRSSSGANSKHKAFRVLPVRFGSGLSCDERLSQLKQVARPPRPVEVFKPPTTISVSQRTSVSLPASRRLVWLLLLPSVELDAPQQHLQSQLRQLPQLQQAFTLAQQFLAMVRQRTPAVLAPWIEACRASGIAELKSFAEALLRDFPVIHPLLELPYSNGDLRTRQPAEND